MYIYIYTCDICIYTHVIYVYEVADGWATDHQKLFLMVHSGHLGAPVIPCNDGKIKIWIPNY